MSDWKQRLQKILEPVLRTQDPRPGISAYHDMPYAIFQYSPEVEFELRSEISMLKTRLEQVGKRITAISLADCLTDALEAEGIDSLSLIEVERSVGLQETIHTIHEIISDYQPLDSLVVQRLPKGSDPLRDIVFITRAGILFPMYRTSSLLDQLMGSVEIPCVLFYPGELDGVSGLRFMGILDAEHNYRPKIF